MWLQVFDIQGIRVLPAQGINQVDPETMERGIYGLGGFLAASDELLILWSKPYLSRLRCMGEVIVCRSGLVQGFWVWAFEFVIDLCSRPNVRTERGRRSLLHPNRCISLWPTRLMPSACL